MTMNMIERAVAAALDELHRQGKQSGCLTEDNGIYVQVDGSFKVEPLVRAILVAAELPEVHDPANDT